jgi:hypothetical protein
MAVYNGMPYLREALDSLLRQTFREFELIVVDDGSEDETPQVLAEYKARDSRIHLLRNEQNLKLPASLNRGLRACRAGLVARADADDFYAPDWLLRQYEFMQSHPEIGKLGTGGWEVDTVGQKSKQFASPSNDALIRLIMPFRCCINHAGGMYRRDLVLEAGGYSEAFLKVEDYDLWARLLPLTQFASLQEPLWCYRTLPSSESRSYNHADGSRMCSVSGRLLCERLGRSLTENEVKAACEIFCSWGPVDSGSVRLGIRLCFEYLRKSRPVAEEKAWTEFKRLLAQALLRQSVHQVPHSRLMSLAAMRAAFVLSPREMLSRQGGLQLFRLLVPGRIWRALKKTRVGTASQATPATDGCHRSHSE